MAVLKAALPEYDDYERALTEQKDREEQIRNYETALRTQIMRKETLSASISAQKAELETLKDSTAESKERKVRKEELEALLAALSDLRSAEAHLEKKQEAYCAALEIYNGLKSSYDEMNESFLNEQAGILATTLREGKRCPVCGSIDHPAPARLSPEAPTEEAVKRAKKLMDEAEQDVSKASLAAGTQKGIAEEKDTAVRALLRSLLPDSTLAEAATVAETEIALLEEQIRAAEENARRKAELEASIPQTEEELTHAQEQQYAANAALAVALQAALVHKAQAKDGGCRRAQYSLLSSLNCPAALVELGYATNEAEAELLNADEYQSKLALALADGIAAFTAVMNPETQLKALPPPPPPPAEPAKVEPPKKKAAPAKKATPRKRRPARQQKSKSRRRR